MMYIYDLCTCIRLYNNRNSWFGILSIFQNDLCEASTSGGKISSLLNMYVRLVHTHKTLIQMIKYRRENISSTLIRAHVHVFPNRGTKSVYTIISNKTSSLCFLKTVSYTSKSIQFSSCIIHVGKMNYFGSEGKGHERYMCASPAIFLLKSIPRYIRAQKLSPNRH